MCKKIAPGVSNDVIPAISIGDKLFSIVLGSYSKKQEVRELGYIFMITHPITPKDVA
jgi:hypothetical protein